MLTKRIARIAGATTLLCAHALALQSGPGAQTGSSPSAIPPNVVMIFIDDVGPDLLGIYDSINPYEGAIDPFDDGVYVKSPTIDSIAAQGVTFLNAYSTPVCSAARASLLTGVRTTKHGVGKVIRPDLVGGLAEFGDPGFEHPTLPELLQSKGVHTGIFGKWHLSLPPGGPSPEGVLGWKGIRQRGHWDEIRCTFSNLDIEPMPAGPAGYYRYFHHIDTNGLGRTVILENYATTQQFTDAANFCNSAPQPFFAYVSTNACHTPLEDLPPADLVNTPEYLVGPPSFHKNFSANLEALDTELGKFLASLNPERKKNTLFILMGDNGSDPTLFQSMFADSALDLGRTYQELVQDDAIRFKHSVYEGGLRVPLIVWGQGVFAPGRTSDVLVNVTDIFPTIADQYGAPITTAIDGRSFEPALVNSGVDLWTHERQSVVVDFFFENGDPDFARDMRQLSCLMNLPGQGQFKLVRLIGLPGTSSEWSFMPEPGIVVDELYQLKDALGEEVDPRELQPLSTDVGSPYRDIYLQLASTLASSLHPKAASNFCGTLPNSTGASAQITLAGTTSLERNDMVLRALELPPNVPAFFFYAWDQVVRPFGNGVLCLDSGGVGLHRLALLSSNSDGILEQAIDYNAINATLSEITVGSTWKFQAWYRDVAAGGAMSNTSDGLNVHFAP